MTENLDSNFFEVKRQYQHTVGYPAAKLHGFKYDKELFKKVENYLSLQTQQFSVNEKLYFVEYAYCYFNKCFLNRVTGFHWRISKDVQKRTKKDATHVRGKDFNFRKLLGNVYMTEEFNFIWLPSHIAKVWLKKVG